MRYPTFRTVHRASGALIFLFAASHLLVHLSAVWGIAVHGEMLRTMQALYRNPIGETVLCLAIVVQIASGLSRLRFNDRSGWAMVQSVSGAVLMVFLTLHTAASLYTHHVFGLDTDFYWAAGSLHFQPIKYGFLIYYFIAVVALFAHVSAALHFRLPEYSKRTALVLPVAGLAIASVVLATFSGLLYPIEFPEGVTLYYETTFSAFGVRK